MLVVCVCTTLCTGTRRACDSYSLLLERSGRMEVGRSSSSHDVSSGHIICSDVPSTSVNKLGNHSVIRTSYKPINQPILSSTHSPDRPPNLPANPSHSISKRIKKHCDDLGTRIATHNRRIKPSTSSILAAIPASPHNSSVTKNSEFKKRNSPFLNYKYDLSFTVHNTKQFKQINKVTCSKVSKRTCHNQQFFYLAISR